MAVRTFVTAGVAFAAAGAVAATVALAPPMSPRDVQVAKSTDVSLNALVTDPTLVPLINAYFNSGSAAVVQQLLLDIVGDSSSPADLVNGFFDTGLSEVVRQYLAAANPTYRPGVEAINIFFNGQNPFGDPDPDDPTINTGVSSNPALFGVSGLVYARLLAARASGDLTQQQFEVIDDFFKGGLSQVALRQLLSRTADPQQREFISDFFSGGVTQNVYTSLSAATTDPQQQKVIDDFFTGGLTEVVKTQLTSRTTDPNQLADIEAFFPSADGTYAGGISENVRIRLLAAANGDWSTQSLINGFFDTGISEVIRQILVGPPDEPAPPTLKAADVQEDPTPVVEKKAKPAPEPVQAAQPVAATAPAAPVAAPAAPVVPSPPPVAAAPEPATPAAVKTVDEDETKDSNDVTDAMKDGNKAEVTPILIVGANGRGPKPGEGSWGVFGQVADAIGKTIAGASAPKASTGSTGSTGTGGS